MEDSINLNKLVRVLENQYLTGGISLNALVHRGETLLEQGKLMLHAEKYRCAINCIYVLEEINALVLDENRSMRAEERSRVEAELRKFALFVAGV